MTLKDDFSYSEAGFSDESQDVVPKIAADRLRISGGRNGDMWMVYEIGDGAGKLWHFLEGNPSSTVEEAAKSLKMKESAVAMAVGWLAREDKLAFEPNGTNGKGVRLSLKQE